MGIKDTFRIHILLIFAISIVWSLSLYPASCPEPKVQENFDIERFSGLWYEVQRTFALVEGGLKCATTVVSGASNKKMRATFRRNGINILNRRITLMRGYLHTPDAKAPAKLELVMGPLSLFLRYRVIDTNYDDYAVVWGCFESPKYSSILGHTENLWILSRNKTIGEEFKQKIYGYLDSINVSRAGLVDTNFENCTSQQYSENCLTHVNRRGPKTALPKTKGGSYNAAYRKVHSGQICIATDSGYFE